MNLTENGGYLYDFPQTVVPLFHNRPNQVVGSDSNMNEKQPGMVSQADKLSISDEKIMNHPQTDDEVLEKEENAKKAATLEEILMDAELRDFLENELDIFRFLTLVYPFLCSSYHSLHCIVLLSWFQLQAEQEELRRLKEIEEEATQDRIQDEVDAKTLNDEVWKVYYTRKDLLIKLNGGKLPEGEVDPRTWKTLEDSRPHQKKVNEEFYALRDEITKQRAERRKLQKEQKQEQRNEM